MRMRKKEKVTNAAISVKRMLNVQEKMVSKNTLPNSMRKNMADQQYWKVRMQNYKKRNRIKPFRFSSKLLESKNPTLTPTLTQVLAQVQNPHPNPPTQDDTNAESVIDQIQAHPPPIG